MARALLAEGQRWEAAHHYGAAVRYALGGRSHTAYAANASPPIPGAAELAAQLLAMRRRNEPLRLTQHRLKRTRARLAERIVNYREYDALLERDAQGLNPLPPSAGEFQAAAADVLRQVDRRRRQIRAQVQRQIAEETRAEALRVYLATRCGQAPNLGIWDGELQGSEAYVRQSAHDPDSVDVENCTRPTLTVRHCWVSQCTVRGNNALGFPVAHRMEFWVGADNRYLGARRL